MTLVPEPPRLARALLRLFLPPADLEYLLGDLEELHRKRISESGRIRAHLWYWREALSAFSALAPARRERLERIAEHRKGDGVMITFWQDLRYGARMLARAPGFALLAIGALALGIGANTAVFSTVNAVLLRPLPFPDSHRVVLLHETNLGKGWSSFTVAPPNFLDWRSQARSFETMAAYVGRTFNFTGRELPEALRGFLVTEGFLETLGAAPFLGRAFAGEDFQPGRDQVALATHAFWQDSFGADPGAIGKSLMLNGKSYTLIGVLPQEFRFGGRGTAMFVPWAFGANERTARGGHYCSVVAKLRAGVFADQAQQEMSGIAAGLEQSYPDSNKGWGILVRRMQDVVVPGATRRMLLILLGAVGFVLVIACANVANMLLARALQRGREIAVRAALGASRGRIVRQLLTESFLLAAIGAIAGVVLAHWGTRSLLAANPGVLPRASDVRVDLTVLAFSSVVAVVTGLVFGLAPSLWATRSDLHETLKEGGRSGTSGVLRQRLRGLLVVAELALALMLLVGAGLLLRSFARLQNVHPGFDSRSTLTLAAVLPRAKYSEPSRVVGFFEAARERLASLPGVESAALTSIVPLSGGDELYSIEFEGRARVPGADNPSALYFVVSPGYFRTMRIPLRAGRDFDPRDRDGALRVAVISESFAQRHFRGENPIGQRIRIGRNSRIIREIVGVVGDVKLYGLEDRSTPQVYEPFAQFPEGGMNFVLRTSVDPLSLGAAARKQVQAIDPDQPVTALQSLDGILADSVALPRFRTLLLGVFAAVALLLAAVGLYGVMSYSVVQRRQEIGIRMALGAGRSTVLGLVLRQAMALAACGVALGVAGAFPLSKVTETLLFEVEPRDLPTFAAVPAALLLVALAAAIIPAWRATRVDPIEALRYE